jgi:hypothetical protein
MNVKDARVILSDLLDKQYVDSILDVYEENEKIYKSIIMLQMIDIKKLEILSQNKDNQMELLMQIIDNQKNEIGYLENTINVQNKQIKKQKRLKIIGFIGIGILTFILIL